MKMIKKEWVAIKKELQEKLLPKHNKRFNKLKIFMMANN